MRKETFYGILGGGALLGVYFSVLIIFNGFEHALLQFSSTWYLVLLLAAGFGVQIGLYAYAKGIKAGSKKTAACGAASTGSMIACCAHHVTDILPVAGLSGALLFAADYQPFFLVLGILSNTIGILIMLNVLQKQGLQGKGFAGNVMKLDMRTARDAAVVFSLMFLALSALNPEWFYLPLAATQKGLNTQVSDANSLSVEVTPVLGNGQIKFSIALNTHSGSLDYDMTRVSVLEDSKGRTYTPAGWDGSASGGHHRSGTLIFQELPQPGPIKLTLKNLYGVDRVFEWRL